MDNHEQEFRITTMSRVLHVSRSAYNHWQSHLSHLSARGRQRQRLVEKIRALHAQSNGTYGSPRIAAQLRCEGTPVDEKTVARMMYQNDIRAKTKKRFKVTTNSTKTKNAAPNVVQQDFSAARPNQLWTSDMTYIWTREGWLYLAIILDLFARRVVGYAMSSRLSASLVTSALHQALTHRQLPADVVLHSDRGSQYASEEVRTMIAAHRLVQSMSGKGNCYDNAITETFFHTLKTELIYWERFETREEAGRKIFDYIEVCYNRQRLHSSLGSTTPMEFEQRSRGLSRFSARSVSCPTLPCPKPDAGFLTIRWAFWKLGCLVVVVGEFMGPPVIESVEFMELLVFKT
jgi:transposase InsO family protein